MEEEKAVSSCERCSAVLETFYEVYDSRGEEKRAELKILCGSCLIGLLVPVFRTTKFEWCFGKVDEFDSTTNSACVLFGEQREWVEIDCRPYTAYMASKAGLASIQKLRPPSIFRGASVPTKVASMKSFDSFDPIMQFVASKPSTPICEYLVGDDIASVDVLAPPTNLAISPLVRRYPINNHPHWTDSDDSDNDM